MFAAFFCLAVANHEPPLWLVAPFAAMLFSIALAPFLLGDRWHRVYPLTTIALGGISIGAYLLMMKNGARVLHIAHEYASFIALVGSLFVVSGGIHIRVKSEAKPWTNALFLLIGAVIANLVGTTGASMLLIRPWIRANRARIAAFHIVFFIFIVSNIGGCLTPIGDPPLFLGYLKGVPFWWVLAHCWKPWLVSVLPLTAIFFVIDQRNFARSMKTKTPPSSANRELETPRERLEIKGWRNLVFLAVILGAIFIQRPLGLRESLMAIAALGSYFATPRAIHAANRFTFEPLRELAWLFAGIFATMIPALDLLELRGASLGLHTPAQFFWTTGALSGVLDNAPTYLAFLATAHSAHQLDFNRAADLAAFVANYHLTLLAISLGAVFFGAMTYIGNGPNFMVKSIAEHEKIPMPGFFGYIFKYALPVLAPLFVIVAILFFSR